MPVSAHRVSTNSYYYCVDLYQCVICPILTNAATTFQPVRTRTYQMYDEHACPHARAFLYTESNILLVRQEVKYPKDDYSSWKKPRSYYKHDPHSMSETTKKYRRKSTAKLFFIYVPLIAWHAIAILGAKLDHVMQLFAANFFPLLHVFDGQPL